MALDSYITLGRSGLRDNPDRNVWNAKLADGILWSRSNRYTWVLTVFL